MKARLLPGLLPLALLLPAAAGAGGPPSGIVTTPVPPGTSVRELGSQLYAGNCASCHGPQGEGVEAPRPAAGGNEGQGPPLRGVGALAADFYLRTGYMPLSRPDVQPRRSDVLFSERQIRAIVAYVASLGRGPAIPKPAPERGNLSVGMRVFAEHCAGCHQIVAQGGYLKGAVAPPLGDVTPTQVAEAVRIGPYVMPKFSKRVISDGELNSLIAYVVQTKHPDDRGGWGLGHIGPVPEGMLTWLVAAAALVAVCVAIGRRLHV